MFAARALIWIDGRKAQPVHRRRQQPHLPGLPQYPGANSAEDSHHRSLRKPVCYLPTRDEGGVPHCREALAVRRGVFGDGRRVQSLDDAERASGSPRSVSVGPVGAADRGLDDRGTWAGGPNAARAQYRRDADPRCDDLPGWRGRNPPAQIASRMARQRRWPGAPSPPRAVPQSLDLLPQVTAALLAGETHGGIQRKGQYWHMYVGKERRASVLRETLVSPPELAASDQVCGLGRQRGTAMRPERHQRAIPPPPPHTPPPSPKSFIPPIEACACPPHTRPTCAARHTGGAAHRAQGYVDG